MTQKYLLMPFVSFCFFQFHSIILFFLHSCLHFPLFMKCRERSKNCDDVQRERYMSLFVIYLGGNIDMHAKEGGVTSLPNVVLIFHYGTGTRV